MKYLGYSELTKRLYILSSSTRQPKIDITDDVKEYIEFTKSSLPSSSVAGEEVKERKVILLTSYCGDNPNCTDDLPCEECLKMCNVAIVKDSDIKKVIVGYDFMRYNASLPVTGEEDYEDEIYEIEDIDTIREMAIKSKRSSKWWCKKAMEAANHRIQLQTGESEAINKAIIEELQSLLSSGVHSEYLPEKINDRIAELKGDKSYT